MSGKVKPVWDCRLTKDQFAAFKEFIRSHEKLGLLTEQEKYQYISGWLKGKGIYHWPVVALIQRVMNGEDWQLSPLQDFANVFVDTYAHKRGMVRA